MEAKEMVSIDIGIMQMPNFSGNQIDSKFHFKLNM